MFGNSRGAYRQNKVIEKFLFLNYMFIMELIDEMINETRRKKVRAKYDEVSGRSEQLTKCDCIKIAMLTCNGNGPDIDDMKGAVEDVCTHRWRRGRGRCIMCRDGLWR